MCNHPEELKQDYGHEEPTCVHPDCYDKRVKVRGPGKPRTRAKRDALIVAMATKGEKRADIAKRAHVSDTTVHMVMTKKLPVDDGLQQVQAATRAKMAEHAASAAETTGQALSELRDRILNGDEKFLALDGKGRPVIQRVKVGAKDLTYAAEKLASIAKGPEQQVAGEAILAARISDPQMLAEVMVAFRLHLEKHERAVGERAAGAAGRVLEAEPG